MSIVANNCVMFNMSMDFWLLRNYSAGDLLDNWNRIFEYANSEKDAKNQETLYFLEDCMDVLYEKVLILPDMERGQILDRANRDMEIYERT